MGIIDPLLAVIYIVFQFMFHNGNGLFIMFVMVYGMVFFIYTPLR